MEKVIYERGKAKITLTKKDTYKLYVSGWCIYESPLLAVMHQMIIIEKKEEL